MAYRVVGIREDGTRVILEEGVAQDRAAALMAALLAANAYDIVRVEDEPHQTDGKDAEIAMKAL